MDQTSSKPIHGSCLCGTVSFSVQGPFQSFYFCHCNRCQKATGSAQAANIFAPLGSINWLAGESSVQYFQLSDKNSFNTAFCKECGSPVPRTGTMREFEIIPAGCLDEDPGVRPDQSIFWEDRAIWDNAGTLPLRTST